MRADIAGYGPALRLSGAAGRAAFDGSGRNVVRLRATAPPNEIMTAMSTRTMRAYVLTGPRQGEVQEVPAPVAAPGEVVIDVERVGVCGTDVEFFTGEMAYLHQGRASYPLRLGHEWAGTVASVGSGLDSAWVGRRVMGDTMLGDGTCRRAEGVTSTSARTGRRSASAEGVPALWPSSWPYRSRRYTPFPTPSTACSVVGGAGRNAFRAPETAALAPDDRALVLGPGTIGILVALFARAAGAEVT